MHKYAAFSFLRLHAWSDLNVQRTVTATHLQCVLMVCVCAVVYAIFHVIFHTCLSEFSYPLCSGYG